MNRRHWIASAALALAGSLASAQEIEKQKPEKELPPLPTATSQQQKMIELFHAVENKLHEIDSILYDAGAGGSTKGKLEDAGIDRLLQQASERGKEAQAGIDQILELARQQQKKSSSSSSSGGEPQQSSGESPLDKQRNQRPSQKDKKPGGEAPRPEDQQQEPQGANQKPESNKDSKDDQQRTGVAPPKGPTEHNPRVDDRERWGDLPIQVRDVFRVEGGGDLPPRYREWIDAYYRRMNQHP
jgi:hypothetical protein